MLRDIEAQLPDGYNLVDSRTVTAEEIVLLRDSADQGTERNLDVWQRTIDQSLAITGVVSRRDVLVGVGLQPATRELGCSMI